MAMGTKGDVMQTLAISEELQRRLDELCRVGGYESLEQYLAQVVDGRLVELRRQRAEQIARRIRQGLIDRGQTEEEVLRDFETFRRRLREDAPAPLEATDSPSAAQ